MKHTSDEQQGDWSRRSFVGVAGVGVAGLGAAAVRAGGETLAIDGGAKAVSVPTARQQDVFKWPRYGEGEKRGVAALLESNKFYDEIEPLEAVCRGYHGVPHAKAHCNGTSALMSMFFALGLPADSEIMVPSYTASATIAPMRFFGCVPIFVDIDPLTACFDLEDARRRLTPRTRALVVMHSWGLPCEMDHIAAFAKEQGLILLEDSAQAFGASMQGKPMGAWGAIGMHSFQASKTVAAVEGGMGLYQTREYYERATAFGNYDLPRRFPENSPYRKYHDTGFGPTFRIHPIAALLARLQIEGVDERNDRLRARTRALNERLDRAAWFVDSAIPSRDEACSLGGEHFVFQREEGGLLARGRAQGFAGRRRAGKHGGVPGTAQVHNLPRAPVVEPCARGSRSPAGLRTSEWLDAASAALP